MKFTHLHQRRAISYMHLCGLHEWTIQIVNLTLIIQWRTKVWPLSKVRNIAGWMIFGGTILTALTIIAFLWASMFGMI